MQIVGVGFERLEIIGETVGKISDGHRQPVGGRGAFPILRSQKLNIIDYLSARLFELVDGLLERFRFVWLYASNGLSWNTDSDTFEFVDRQALVLSGTVSNGRSQVRFSLSLFPAIALKMVAASFMVRVNRPTVSRLFEAETTPSRATRPVVGLSPTRFPFPAGLQILPSVCEWITRKTTQRHDEISYLRSKRSKCRTKDSGDGAPSATP